VLAVGDAAFQNKCIGKMDELAHRDGRTVLFVSHNLGAVQRLCNRALLLDSGRIQSIGSAAEVLAHYGALTGSAQALGPIRSGPAALEIVVDPAESGLQNTVSMGSAVRLVVDLKVDRPVRQASLGIGVEAATGERVLTFDTTLQHRESWSIDSHARLVIEWPECMLCQGVYRFVAGLYQSGEAVAVWYDAGTLTVLEADYFGTQHVPAPSHQGKVFTKASWSITECG
jgi:lipopolysaccharide transport system ATP-binding protein